MPAVGDSRIDRPHGREIDDDAHLMEESYRLRYRVYCEERRFLHPGDYPDGVERDEFDRYAIHVGVTDGRGVLLATARLVRPNITGLPLFRHCRIFPNETELYEESNDVVEVSRLCVSRRLRNRGKGRSAVTAELYRALYRASRRRGHTHWLVATEPSLQRLVADFGFPFRAVGPSTDYFGAVTPYLMDLQLFEQVILSRTRPLLDSFLEPSGSEPAPPLCGAVDLGG
jgi:N-acyl-L-homoserine lactone synthetase